VAKAFARTVNRSFMISGKSNFSPRSFVVMTTSVDICADESKLTHLGGMWCR